MTMFFYVPFPRTVVNGDIRTNANEVAQYGIGNALGGAVVVLVFKGEEGMHHIGGADYLCVHAHGGSGDYVNVTNNQGNETTLDELSTGLETMGAENAIACYFFICFSAQDGHIADAWKADHAEQMVYGCAKVAEGAVVSTLKSGKVKSSIFLAGNGQLSLVGD